MNVIHLNLQKPDNHLLKADDHGRLMAKFLIEYQMDGKTFADEIWAYSPEDAEQRVSAMCKSLVVLGHAYSDGNL